METYEWQRNQQQKHHHHNNVIRTQMQADIQWIQFFFMTTDAPYNHIAQQFLTIV